MDINNIRQLLQAERALLDAMPDTPPPHDYKSLQDAIILEERKEVLQTLEALFSASALTEDQIKEQFKTFAIARAKANQGTAFSYFAMPNGYCNELCWKVAQDLFDTKRLGKTLEILLPSPTLLEIECVPQKQVSPDQWELSLQSAEMSTLEEEAKDPQVLTRFAEGNGKLLDLSFIAALGFNQYA